MSRIIGCVVACGLGALLCMVSPIPGSWSWESTLVAAPLILLIWLPWGRS